MKKIIKVKNIQYVIKRNGIYVVDRPVEAPESVKIIATEWVKASVSIYDFAEKAKRWIETGTGMQVASFILVNAHRMHLDGGEKNLEVVYTRGY